MIYPIIFSTISVEQFRIISKTLCPIRMFHSQQKTSTLKLLIPLIQLIIPQIRGQKKSRPIGRDLSSIYFTDYCFLAGGLVVAAAGVGLVAPAGTFKFNFLATNGNRLSAGGATNKDSMLYTYE